MAARPKSIRFQAKTSNAPKVRAVGQRWAPQDDLYHYILIRPWWEFFGLVVVAFLVLNALFAGVYSLAPNSIAGARPGSYEDAFFFSVQTMTTIGYGTMAPASRFGHVVSAAEALASILCIALITGITFAKFARPSARVLFSEKIVIAPRNGVPHMMFRMANWRHNQILEAQLRVGILVLDKTQEGQTLRRPIEVPLLRDRTPLFSLSWTAMHRIDEASPFYGEDAIERLREQQSEIYLSLSGLDETTASTVHARRVYALDDIVPNALFADVLIVREDGTRVIDYQHFHEVVPLDEAVPASRKDTAT
jgi:inward rectifier potassium channel